VTPDQVDLGFPSVEQVSYLKMLKKQQSLKYHNQCQSTVANANTQAAFLEM